MPYPLKNPLLRLENCPPFLAHALARERNGKKRLALNKIVERSGLPERTYLRTACKDSWDGVKYGVIKKFLKGCGVNPFQMNKDWRFLRVHNFQFPYLTKKQQQVMDGICAKKI